jgi:signal peptidase I
MDFVTKLTENLATLSIKWVLLGVGIMILLLTLFRLFSRERDRDGTIPWLVENLQVVLSVVVVVFLLIRPYLFQAFYIPSSSMEPTLMGPANPNDGSTGDRLLVNKLIYKVGDPSRHDIVVFHAPPAASPPDDENPQGKEFIKRVIALPNETIRVLPPRLLVDGKHALNLSTEGAQNTTIPGLSTDTKELAGKIQATEAELPGKYGDRAVRVIARPRADLRFNPYRVDVDGKVALRDEEGRIASSENLIDYGGEGVKGTIYSIEDEPRLIVLNGSALQYDPGHVLVDDRRLDENYILEPPDYEMTPKKLGPNEYFMMGDNRNNSNDSHMWGALTRDRVIGRAEILFWPLPRFEILHWWLISVLFGLFLGYHIVQRALTPR